MVIRRYLAIGAAALTVGLAVFLRAGGTALAVLLGLCLALGLIKALRPLWRPLLCGLLAAALMGGLYAWRYTAAEQLTGCELPDRKSTRLNSSHKVQSRMPSSA